MKPNSKCHLMWTEIKLKKKTKLSIRVTNEEEKPLENTFWVVIHKNYYARLNIWYILTQLICTWYSNNKYNFISSCWR